MSCNVDTIADVLDAYAELERDVGDENARLFSSVCALCTSTCCTPDICEESQDSAFLCALRSRHAPEATFCERFGWLTERGCALTVGRPPVCYGFFCDDILDALTEEQRSALRVLGRILSWVGDKALGSVHVVEILDRDDLKDIKGERLMARIETGRLALQGARAALSGEPGTSAWIDAMQQVVGQRNLTLDM